MNKENNVSEYKIGRTTYIVKLVFNPASKERLTDILQRLIDRECEEMLGESGQEPEKVGCVILAFRRIAIDGILRYNDNIARFICRKRRLI